MRAAAVSSLAKFGVNVPDLGVKASIKVLLTRFVAISIFLCPDLLHTLTTRNRCLDDVDDEVRDRAALYLKVLDQEPLADKFVKDGKPSAQ